MQASAKRQEASVLECAGGSMPDDQSDTKGGYAQSCGGGSVMSETESKRLATCVAVQAIYHLVLGTEDVLLSRLHLRYVFVRVIANSADCNGDTYSCV